MANEYETASLTFPSGLVIHAQRITTNGGSPDDKAVGWVSFTSENDGQTWAVGARGPIIGGETE